MSDIQIFDIAYNGVNTLDQLQETWDKDALINALTLWMASFTDERVHGARRGGAITRHLAKPMTQTDALTIDFSIRTGLDTDFLPKLQVVDLKVTPVYDQRYWNIQLTVYSPDLKTNLSVNQKLKNLV